MEITDSPVQTYLNRQAPRFTKSKNIDLKSQIHGSNSVTQQLDSIEPKSELFAQLLASAKLHFLENPYRNIWVGIDRSALLHNVETIRAMEPGKRFCAVLKADAYGHGIDIVAPVLEPHIDAFGITENHEASTIFNATSMNKPVIRVRLADSFEIGEAMENDTLIEELVGNVEQAERISALSQALDRPPHPIHLALDTAGMGRDGFNTSAENWSNLVEQVKAIKQLPGVKIVGIYGHLPVSDDPNFNASRESSEQFIAHAVKLKALIGNEVEIHLFASAGTRRATQIPAELREHITLNRAGGALFGHKSFATEDVSTLRHVMTVCTFVTGLFDRPAGASVGYGSHYKVRSDRGETHAHVPGGWAILPREALLAKKDRQGVSALVITNELGGTHEILGNPSMNSVICMAKSQDGKHQLSEMEPVFIIAGKNPIDSTDKENSQVDAGSKKTMTQDSNQVADLLGSTGARVTVHIGTAKNVARLGFN